MKHKQVRRQRKSNMTLVIMLILTIAIAAVLLLRGEIIEQNEISAAPQPIAFFDFSAGTVGEAADEIADASGTYVGRPITRLVL